MFHQFLDMHTQTTINGQNLACNIACFRRTKEVDRHSNLINSTETIKRGRVKHKFALLLGNSGCEFGGHKSWGDRVNGRPPAQRRDRQPARARGKPRDVR